MAYVRVPGGARFPLQASIPVGVVDEPIDDIPGIYTVPAPDWVAEGIVPWVHGYTPRESWRATRHTIDFVLKHWSTIG